jgi:hypothetical protein
MIRENIAAAFSSRIFWPLSSKKKVSKNMRKALYSVYVSTKE